MAFGNNNASSRARRIMADINVTPLTDVFLVLLIIFMITTSAMMKPEDVQLPENAEEQEETQGVLVTITPSREIYVNDRLIEHCLHLISMNNLSGSASMQCARPLSVKEASLTDSDFFRM